MSNTAPPECHAQGPPDADEVLRRLAEGNRRFTSGAPRHNVLSQERLASLAARQQPFATILGCSDSRVPPELVFDQGFGDLFVMRLAGNIIAPGVLGTLQYAHLQLGINVLVVLGHEGCGAVRAALACKLHQERHPEHIQNLVDLVAPGLTAIALDQPPEEQMKAAVAANVRWSVQQILHAPEFPTPATPAAANAGSPLRVVGAVYELATGNVRWLDP